MRYVLMAAFVFFAVATDVEAGPVRRSRQSSGRTATPAPAVPAAPIAAPIPEAKSATPAVEKAATVNGVDDALAEVNAARAKRGLAPFLPDPQLNQAARTCAKIRAASFIEAHLASDFAYVPAGTTATSAGCGALEPSWGWGTCCTYDNYTYAGAAWVMGADGKRYMHLFVR